MSSNLRVNNILPSVGTNVAIGTAGGSITLTGTVSGSSNINVGTGASVYSPTTNVLALGTNNVESVRIDSSGNLGIGTNNPTKALHISQNSDVAIRMHSGNSNTNARSWEIVVGGNASNNAEMVFRTRNDAGTGGSEAARFTASGNLAFPSGQGIDFSTTANSSGTMTSEILDDYEEGTWTPVLLGSTSESGQTYGGRQGQYTKIGNMVFLRYKLWLTAAGTFTGTYCLLGGFPFNIQGSSGGGVDTVGDGIVYHVNLVNNVYLLALQQLENDNKAYFWNKNTLSSSRQYYNGSQIFANNTEISGTVCYQTAS